MLPTDHCYCVLSVSLGDAGNDIFFVGTNLQNAWTVQSIETPLEGTADPFGDGNVAVVDSRIQTNPSMLYFNVRWWFDAFAYANYSQCGLPARGVCPTASPYFDAFAARLDIPGALYEGEDLYERHYAETAGFAPPSFAHSASAA